MELPHVTDFAATADRLAPALLDGAVRGAVIFALAGLTALAMRRASAAARHWVWLLAFAGLLLLPAFSAVLPGWRVLPRLAARPTPPAAASGCVTPPVAPLGGSGDVQDPTANAVADSTAPLTATPPEASPEAISIVTPPESAGVDPATAVPAPLHTDATSPVPAASGRCSSAPRWPWRSCC